MNGECTTPKARQKDGLILVFHFKNLASLSFKTFAEVFASKNKLLASSMSSFVMEGFPYVLDKIFAGVNN